MEKITITDKEQTATAIYEWDQEDFSKVILDGVTCGKGGIDLASSALNIALAKIKDQTFFADSIIVTAASTSDLDGEQPIETVVAFFEAQGFRVSDEQGGDSVFMERLI